MRHPTAGWEKIPEPENQLNLTDKSDGVSKNTLFSMSYET